MKETENENLENCFIQSGRKIGLDVKSGDIENIHRLGKPKDDKVRPIIVKLSSTKLKKNIITKSLQYNKQNSSKYIVREHLTQYRKSIYDKLISLRKNNTISSLYTNDGIINVSHNGKKHFIKNESDYRIFLDLINHK